MENLQKRTGRTCQNNCSSICGECQIWENLTIKELAALAANGTKVYVFDKPEFLQRYLEIAPNGNWAVELTLENCKEYVIKNGYKPILFPLSSLTKPITINGETFVPIIKWEWFGADFNTNYFNHTNFKPRYEPYYKSEQMLSAYFDVFNLIERGLAIPVTETFNPYK